MAKLLLCRKNIHYWFDSYQLFDQWNDYASKPWMRDGPSDGVYWRIHTHTISLYWNIDEKTTLILDHRKMMMWLIIDSLSFAAFFFSPES